MKILVLSDSHRSMAGIYNAIDTVRPDHVIHLGDLLEDAEYASLVYPTLPICKVPGNCDGWTSAEAVKQITLGGKSILLSHGHLWGVKSGYDRAIAQARAVRADILLFGHTHTACCQQLEDGLWMLNPGSSRSTYGLIELNDGQIRCSTHHQS